MSGGPSTDFQDNADYIAFAFSPPAATAPLPPVVEAGPSRPVNGGPKAGAKKQKPTKADKKAARAQSGQVNGAGAKGKGKGKEKEKGTGPRNLKEERKAAERAAPWAENVAWGECHDGAEMLNKEVEAFYHYVSPTRAEFEVRLFIIELITRTVSNAFPEAIITPFGSWQTQMYLPTGDIDLVVSLDSPPNKKAQILASLGRAMRAARITDVVAVIANARVPIIKFVTTDGRLNVDISLNQTNGISAGKIINQYLDILPGARQLIMVVKAFLSQRSMNEVFTGGLGSYSVICMVISFLQIHPKLRRMEMNPEENLGPLLIEFLELYGRNFNYDTVGLSIRKGGYYFSKHARRWTNVKQGYLLSIEDPQDPDNDIAKGSYGIRNVRSSFSGAQQMLQDRLIERAARIARWRSGNGPTEVDPEEMSILAGIMGITKETQKHRTEIQKLHNEGRLQRLLHIPTGAKDLGRYIQNYRSPKPQETPRPNGVGIKRPVDEEDAPEVSKRQRTAGAAVNAILVDDEEEGDDVEDDESASDDEDDEGEEEQDDDEEGELERDDEEEEEEEEWMNEILPTDSEDGEIKERNQSVSEDDLGDLHDLDDNDELGEAETEEEESGDESRYAVGRATPRKAAAVNGGGEGGVGESDSSDIEEIAPPPASSSSISRATNGTAGASRKRKEDFWAAKGRRSEAEAKDLEENADFVSF